MSDLTRAIAYELAEELRERVNERGLVDLVRIYGGHTVYLYVRHLSRMKSVATVRDDGIRLSLNKPTGAGDRHSECYMFLHYEDPDLIDTVLKLMVECLDDPALLNPDVGLMVECAKGLAEE